jgi:hypothetical protein
MDGHGRPGTGDEFTMEDGIDAGGSGRGRDGEMLQGGAVGSIWVVGDAEQLLTLLVFENTSLVLEHFALEEPLSLVLHTLEFDTLWEKRVKYMNVLVSEGHTAERSGMLEPSLAVCVASSRWRAKRQEIDGTHRVSEVQESWWTVYAVV